MGNTVDTVTAVVKPFADEMGYDIWDIRFEKEGQDRFLRIFIDKPDGISVNDCEALSRAIDAPLDEADPIEGSYCLEVCSPGLERRLMKEEHFEKMRGRKVKLRTIRKTESGQRDFSGVLRGLSGGKVIIESSGTEMSFDKKELSFVKADDFDQGKDV